MGMVGVEGVLHPFHWGPYLDECRPTFKKHNLTVSQSIPLVINETLGDHLLWVLGVVCVHRVGALCLESTRLYGGQMSDWPWHWAPANSQESSISLIGPG